MSEPQCLEDVDFGDSALMCWLPRDHGGLHYDQAMNVSWREGAPGTLMGLPAEGKRRDG